ncbi:MAG TPA: hypothetical protein PLB01_04180 [Thermoanaerobaculia bacterium]|nr:hypothetical protein [Thermoanaerobaculia bacterium]
MFRTARAFLLVLPGAFLVVLSAYLVAHPGAADAFVAYPFLAESLGSWVSKRPLIRFVLTSVVFFVPPYLVTGLLLFVADAGVSAAAPLWGEARKKRPGAGPPPESRWGFVAVSLACAAAFGVLLHRVAHGGELPGGVNVSPLFVVIAAFGAVGVGLVAAGLAALPRAVARRLGAAA